MDAIRADEGLQEKQKGATDAYFVVKLASAAGSVISVEALIELIRNNEHSHEELVSMAGGWETPKKGDTSWEYSS